jgi:hypothetical protein
MCGDAISMSLEKMTVLMEECVGVSTPSSSERSRRDTEIRLTVKRLVKKLRSTQDITTIP